MEVFKSMFGGFRIKFTNNELAVMKRYIRETATPEFSNVSALIGSGIDVQLDYMLESQDVPFSVADSILDKHSRICGDGV